MNYSKSLFLALTTALFGLALPLEAQAQLSANLFTSSNYDFFEQYLAPKTADEVDGFVHEKKGARPTAKSAAEQQEELIFSKLRIVGDLVKKNQMQQALDEMHALNAIPNKTPHENFLIDRTRVAIAALTKNEALLMRSAQAVIASGQLPADEQAKFVGFVASTYYNDKDYANSIIWTKRYFKEGGTDPSMRRMLAFSCFFNNDFAQAAQEVNADILAAEKEGRKPAEEQLRLLVNSEQKLNNQSGYLSAIEKYVSYYPKKEYWAELLNRVVSKPEFSDRLALDIHRLMMATNQATTAADYMEMSQLALQAGYAEEAKHIVDQGFRSGVLGQGPDAIAHKQLLKLATKMAANEAKAIDKDAPGIIKSRKSNELVTLGFGYVERGMFDKGISLMEQGLRMGGSGDRVNEDKLHLAIAYVKAGRKEEAVQEFKTVQGMDGSAELARYWLLNLKANSNS